MTLLEKFPRFHRVLCCIELASGVAFFAVLLFLFHVVNFIDMIVVLTKNENVGEHHWIQTVMNAIGVVLALYLLIIVWKVSGEIQQFYFEKIK